MPKGWTAKPAAAPWSLARPAGTSSVRVLPLVQVFLALRGDDQRHHLRQPGPGRHLRVVPNQPNRILPGLLDDVLVAQQRQLFERGGSARLGGAEHVALASQLEVGLGQLEAVGGGNVLGTTQAGRSTAL